MEERPRDDAGPEERLEEDPTPVNREERLAYLEGLAEGIQEAEAAATANLLAGIVEVLGEISDEIRHLHRAQRDLESDVEDLAEELTAETQDIVVSCPSCGSEVAFASNLLEEEEVELTCPNCGGVVYTPGEDELVEEDRDLDGFDDPDGDDAFDEPDGDDAREETTQDGEGFGLHDPHELHDPDGLDGLSHSGERSGWHRGDDPWERGGHPNLETAEELGVSSEHRHPEPTREPR